MKFLFVLTPKFYWPILSEYDNLAPPLGVLSIAGALEEEGVEVEIIDCPIEKIGWNSLKKILEKKNFDYLGISEISIYEHEASELIDFVKGIKKDVITIAGGSHYSFALESLNNPNLDFIVRGEGEKTLITLINKIEKYGKNSQQVSKIRGIALKRHNKIIDNGFSSPIMNLDELPMPAWHLYPMEKLSDKAMIFKKGVTLERGRGCISKCNFCILWKQFGRFDRGSFHPCYRTKSVDRALEEVEIVTNKYKVKTIEWVDPTWNMIPAWTKEFCDKVISNNLDKTRWFAYMRADKVIEDKNLSLIKLEKQAGLSMALIGVERATDDELKEINKTNYNTSKILEAFRALKKEGIFTLATFTIGTKYEDMESLKRIFEFAKEVGSDFVDFHPISPLEGTDFTIDSKKDDMIIKDFSRYDFVSSQIRSVHLSAKEIEKESLRMAVKYSTQPRWLIQMVRPDYIGSIYRTFFRAGLGMLQFKIKKDLKISNRTFAKSSKRASPYYGYLMMPKWYFD